MDEGREAIFVLVVKMSLFKPESEATDELLQEKSEWSVFSSCP